MKKQNCVICIQIYTKTDHICKEIPEDVETRFDRLLAKWKNKFVIGLIKDELGGTIMTQFFGLRVKAYRYLIGDGSEDNN